MQDEPITESMHEDGADVLGTSAGAGATAAPPPDNSNSRKSPSPSSSPSPSPPRSPTHSHSRTESQSPVRHGRLENEQTAASREHLGALDAAKKTLDRQKVCPMYVRLFCRMHGHHSPSDFSARHQPTDDELTVYTWRDATLSELADLIKEVNVECRRRDAAFDFQLVYADLRGKFMFKPMGRVMNARPSRGDSRTLEDIRFMQGDFIDVAITFGTSASMVRSPPPVPVGSLKRPFDDVRMGVRDRTERPGGRVFGGNGTGSYRSRSRDVVNGFGDSSRRRFNHRHDSVSVNERLG